MLETNCVSVRFSDDRWQRVRTASVFLTITTTEQKKKGGGGMGIEGMGGRCGMNRKIGARLSLPVPPMKLPSMSDVIDCANVCQSLNKPTPL